MRFIDLFAGLGGFHLALSQLGHECVFASEIEPGLQDLYQRNFGMTIAGDIRGVPSADIPAHDLLCAGFPCQPFSKAGFQDGFKHATDGTLFHEILRIATYHRPRYLLLENVANFEHHDSGNTWRVAKGSLQELGYEVDMRKLSPHELGVPQMRERVYILARLDTIGGFEWPQLTTLETTLTDLLDTNPEGARPIPDNLAAAVDVWQEFVERFPKDEELPSFPIWSMEFGATYPAEGMDQRKLRIKDMARLRGSHGISLETAKTWAQVWSMVPSHAREASFPRWKRTFIRQNRELYERHHTWIDEWLPSIKLFPSSFQKLEWNCHGERRRLRNYILQARPSGIRVKRANWSPALVSLTTTQVPIVGWEDRYMTPDECKRLQSMEGLSELPEGRTKAYRALGNGVNVEVARRIAERIVQPDRSVELQRQVVTIGGTD